MKIKSKKLSKIEKEIGKCMEKYIGEPIDDITLSKIEKSVQKLINNCFPNQYKVIMDRSNNSPKNIDNQILNIDLILK
jgi:hypothetical protein